MNDSMRRIKLWARKLGSCIERARPYYEALEIAKKAQQECQRAAVKYQRANGLHFLIYFTNSICRNTV